MSGRGPNIEDQGRCGYPFAHIDFISDPGAWADALRFTVNIKVVPYEPLKSGFDAVEGRDNPEALPPVSRSFHSSTDSSGGQP